MSDENTQRALGRIEGTLASIKDLLSDHKNDQDALERRVSKVEGKQHVYSGVAATLGTLAGIFFGSHR